MTQTEKLVIKCPIKSLVLTYTVISVGLNFVVLVLVLALVLVSNMSIIKTLGIGLELFPISRLSLGIGLEKNSISRLVLVLVLKEN